jgi:hypothetical protein
MLQRLYNDALNVYQEGLKRVTRLDEPGSVAVTWHQIGLVHQEADSPRRRRMPIRKRSRSR